MLDAAGKLLEFNSSCAPVFVQRGGLAALALADDFVPGLVGAPAGLPRPPGAAACRRCPACTVASPPGGMYAFFRVEGEDDSLAFAKRLVAEHGLGLAPGAAFGPEGEGWLRWCFASRDPARLDAGAAAAGARRSGYNLAVPFAGAKQHGAGWFHWRPQVKPETVAALRSPACVARRFPCNQEIP